MPKVYKYREAIRMIEQAGWVYEYSVGSHRQFRHPFKPGKVTIAGQQNDDVPPGTLRSILKQAGLR